MKESKVRAMKKNKNESPLQHYSRFEFFCHQFVKNKGAVAGLIIFAIIVIAGISAGFIWDYETDIIGMNAAERMIPPCWEHPFGTDTMGRDMLARVCYGARFSIVMGGIAVGISFVFGVLLGAIAGYFGGWIDSLIMRGVELFMMIPGIMVVIVFIAAFGINTRNLVVAIGLSTVPQFTRTMRASVLQIRSSEYVEAAKAIGCSNFKIIITHIIPNAINTSVVYATVRFGSAISDCAAFSFLGLGVPVPLPEWGALLSDGRMYMRESPYLILFPGLAIMLTVLAANLAGDGFRDALDPKMKR